MITQVVDRLEIAIHGRASEIAAMLEQRDPGDENSSSLTWGVAGIAGGDAGSGAL
jgi:hypothetical protein